MASSTISDQEFERLQNQMLELKTHNYSLDDQCRRKDLELLNHRQRCETLEKELVKYQNLAKLNPLSFAKSFQLGKGKENKDKEAVDQLLQENEHLQRKIQLQEDEFRLTNDTLRDEINRLIKLSDVLSSQNVLSGDAIDITTDTKNKLVAQVQPLEQKVNGEDYDETKEIEMIANANKINQNLSYAVLREKEQLEARISEYSSRITQLEQENHKLLESSKFSSEAKISYEKKLDESEKMRNTLQSQLVNLEQRMKKIEKERTEFKELSDKRHMLIDELRMEVEEMTEQIQTKIDEADKRAATVKSELGRELSLLRNEKKEFLGRIELLNEQIGKLSQVEKQNVILNKEIEQWQQKFEKMEAETAESKVDRSVIDQLKEEHDALYDQLVGNKEEEIRKMNQEKEQLKAMIEEHKEEIQKLKQSLEDQVEERKIHEKKGVMYVRELKKQLNNEKKQKEKLQEKFGDLLSEMPLDVSSKSFDTTSVGSWSFLSTSKEAQVKNASTLSIHSSSDDKDTSNGSSGHTNDATVFSSNSTTVNGVNTSFAQNQMLEQENTMLVSRITQLQQEKWTLEERLNQLTILNEEISTELQNKQKIIAFYCMERRGAESRLNSPSNDKFTVKKVVDFIKDKGDDNLKEINRKLQRMLEETLIKNMHLQTNLETLTREIHDKKP